MLRRRNTWLKVLSRITEPSAGRVTIKGRVASLLETCPEQGRRGGHGLPPRADRAGERLPQRRAIELGEEADIRAKVWYHRDNDKLKDQGEKGKVLYGVGI